MILKLFLTIILLLWAGMVLGISFLESWVKFQTPSLTRAIALDVGRTVFNTFQKIQLFILLMIFFISISTSLTLSNWLILFLLTIILLTQILFLFPTLNQRAQAMMRGEKLEKSKAHRIYGVLELCKLILLLAIAISLLLP